MTSHSERVSNHRLQLREEDWRGYGIFDDLDSPGSRIVCPITADFVIPYIERSEIVSVDFNQIERPPQNDTQIPFYSTSISMPNTGRGLDAVSALMERRPLGTKVQYDY